MPQTTHAQAFDAIVIGAGQSGPPLAARLAAAGRKVLLIEREHLGGTCVNNGCIPTKSLVASARVAHMARRAADFGVSAGTVTVDMAKVKARKDAIVNDSVVSLTDWLNGTDNLILLWGTAPLHRSTRDRGEGPALHGATDFPRCRCPADRARLAGHQGRALPD